MGDRRSDSRTLLGAAGAVIAVACCAGLPALGTIVGGLTVAAVLGVAGGVALAAGALAAVVLLLRARRRRACAPADARTVR
jgi:hypothetical protein